jgi:hypothetical protein
MEIDPHQKVDVCIHAFEGSKPVTLATRSGGDWCFLCGEEHEDIASSHRVVEIDHLFEKDPSLKELKDLPNDREAERAQLGGEWLRTQSDPDG